MSASYGRIPRSRSSAGQHTCAICTSHAQASFRRSRKELARDSHLHAPIASPSPCIDPAQIPCAVGDSRHSGDDASVASAMRRRSLILDRWATQQAREAITTLERKENEAELSALSHAQPVSALGSAFLRDRSPAPSDGSVGIHGLRTSSLVQRWKEFEASASSRANAVSNASSEISTEDERFVAAEESMIGWESDQTVPSEPRSSVWASDCGESERGRVAETIRRLSSISRAPSSASSWSDDIDSEQAFPREAFPPEHSTLENARFQAPGRNPARFRRPQLVHGLLQRIREERRSELTRMVDRRAVSRFSHRRRIQALLRYRLLRRNAACESQSGPTPTAIDLDQLQNATSILLSRASLDHRSQQDIHITPQINQNASISNDSSNCSSPCPNGSLDPQHSDLTAEIESGIQQFQEPDVRHEECQPRLILLPGEGEEMLEEAHQSSDVPSQDRGLEAADFVPSLPSWEPDVVMSEVVDENQQNSAVWSPDDFHQERSWDNSQTQSNAWVDDISGNVEIRELVERRRVTLTLASDFRERMNSLILSFLQRRVNQTSTDDGYSIADEEQGSFVHLQNQEAETVDPVASTSLQLPLPTYAYNNQESWQISPLTRYPSCSPEMELICDLRGDMARLYKEMSELKKTMDSCMQIQVEIKDSIKKENFPSTGQLVESLKIVSAGGSHREALQSSTQVPLMRGKCCICYEMQVDSLLYKCGHMCTCFKCAQELLSSSSKCPFCRAPIIDVVRAYSEP